VALGRPLRVRRPLTRLASLGPSQVHSNPTLATGRIQGST